MAPHQDGGILAALSENTPKVVPRKKGPPSSILIQHHDEKVTLSPMVESVTTSDDDEAASESSCTASDHVSDESGSQVTNEEEEEECFCSDEGTEDDDLEVDEEEITIIESDAEETIEEEEDGSVTSETDYNPEEETDTEDEELDVDDDEESSIVAKARKSRVHNTKHSSKPSPSKLSDIIRSTDELFQNIPDKEKVTVNYFIRLLEVQFGNIDKSSKDAIRKRLAELVNEHDDSDTPSIPSVKYSAHSNFEKSINHDTCDLVAEIIEGDDNSEYDEVEACVVDDESATSDAKRKTCDMEQCVYNSPKKAQGSPIAISEKFAFAQNSTELSAEVSPNAKGTQQTPSIFPALNESTSQASESTDTTDPVRAEKLVKRGKWTLGSKIGSGAFGIVYVGMNTLNGTLMAVKQIRMDRAIMNDLRREIELLKSLNHPNIVRYLGAEVKDSQLHIFQEWVPGGSVTGMLLRFGPFSLNVIRSYISQALQGLSYLHGNGIIHRDIKGSNLLVNDSGIVKLADFGASRKIAQGGIAMSLTMRGTPYFMAPEVFEERYSEKADLWSIGCVMVQMFTGSPPFDDLGFTNPVSLYNHVKNLNLPPRLVKDTLENTPFKFNSQFSIFEAMVASCFRIQANERPSADILLQNPFFLEAGCHSDEETESLGIFSPCESWETLKSPGLLAPLRRKSTGHTHSPSMTPPLVNKTDSPMRLKCSLYPKSPPPDTNHWPSWARHKYSSLKRSPVAIGSIKVDQLSESFESLALSEDSHSLSRNRMLSKSIGHSQGTASPSPLHGLRFLDS